MRVVKHAKDQDPAAFVEPRRVVYTPFSQDHEVYAVPACLNCGDELGVPGDAVVGMFFRPRRNYQMDIRLVKSIDEFL